MSAKAPHSPAAFINVIAEEGTKEEAIKYLQETWNENVALSAQVRELREENERLRNRWDTETCGRCGYMRSPASPCKCGQFVTHGTNDHLRQSLSTAREEIRKLTYSPVQYGALKPTGGANAE